MNENEIARQVVEQIKDEIAVVVLRRYEIIRSLTEDLNRAFTVNAIVVANQFLNELMYAYENAGLPLSEDQIREVGKALTTILNMLGHQQEKKAFNIRGGQG